MRDTPNYAKQVLFPQHRVSMTMNYSPQMLTLCQLHLKSTLKLCVMMWAWVPGVSQGDLCPGLVRGFQRRKVSAGRETKSLLCLPGRSVTQSLSELSQVRLGRRKAYNPVSNAVELRPGSSGEISSQVLQLLEQKGQTKE